ncbi:MAG: UDP-N-acetylglucosamine 1-carboxyvinyltransferase [Rhodospirillaceae bacterium]|nr:UDP-N-acetylglucosamine 1-carboxyvinyltransferase [Rhodospirillaceae bacterium]|tara:strand:- start:8079 stop:9350 length:1272 start_codon:yes stop_codon:yes gene_type:complete
MDQIKVRGGIKLNGIIEVSGSKNASLPIIIASLLTERKVTVRKVPDLADVRTILELLTFFGSEIKLTSGVNGKVLEINNTNITINKAPYELVRKMRASVLVLGALLARYGKASVSLPGGCAIGTRPIDIHLNGLESLGASISLEDGYVNAEAKKGLIGSEINLPKVSVGATENLMMAATLAKGKTVLFNCAKEPEISELGKFLNTMGAKILGLGTDKITIYGVDELGETDFTVANDRIETGTYAIAAAITGGVIKLQGAQTNQLFSVFDILSKTGVSIVEDGDAIIVSREGDIIPFDIATQPYPGFPTDMQAQIMALLSLANGSSIITENIFENRFMHIPELVRMGANITQEGPTAIIKGVKKLKGAPVMATDLRASVSLVLAGLAAQGETVISRIYHLDRGYEDLVQKLTNCGADIDRITGF